MGYLAPGELASLRIARLEEALADYALHFGLTEKARVALGLGERATAKRVAVPQAHSSLIST